MRTWLLAFPVLVAGMTAANAAVFPVEVTITEVLDDTLTVAEDDAFTGEIAYDPGELALLGVATVDDVTLDFGEAELTDEVAEPGLAVFDLPTGGLGLAMTVNDIAGVFGFAGTLDFEGLGADSFAFVGDEGAVVRGEFTVTPVPGALPLLATGLAGLAWWRRRRPT